MILSIQIPKISIRYRVSVCENLIHTANERNDIYGSYLKQRLPACVELVVEAIHQSSSHKLLSVNPQFIFPNSFTTITSIYLPLFIYIKTPKHSFPLFFWIRNLSNSRDILGSLVILFKAEPMKILIKIPLNFLHNFYWGLASRGTSQFSLNFKIDLGSNSNFSFQVTDSQR